MLYMKFFTRIIFSIFELFILLQVVSCSKSGGTVFYDCPAFADPVYDQWFPYLQGQIIRFKNAGGLENSITIDRMDKTPDYKYYDGGGSCAPKVTVRSSQGNSSSIPFQLEYGKGAIYNSMYIELKTIVVNANGIKDTGLVITPSAFNRFNRTEFFSTYTLNGINYTNVQVITRDTFADKAVDIYKIIIAKKMGILAFEEFPSLGLWTKE